MGGGVLKGERGQSLLFLKLSDVTLQFLFNSYRSLVRLGYLSNLILQLVLVELNTVLWKGNTV